MKIGDPKKEQSAKLLSWQSKLLLQSKNQRSFSNWQEPTWNHREKRVPAVYKAEGFQGSGSTQDKENVLHVERAVDQPQGGQLRPELEGILVLPDQQRHRDAMEHEAADILRRLNGGEVSVKLKISFWHQRLSCWRIVHVWAPLPWLFFSNGTI